MRPTCLLRAGRSAWKGPYFVAFPNLKEALENNLPIKTQARSCTILPNFVGYLFFFLSLFCFTRERCFMSRQHQISRSQRERLHSRRRHGGHGRVQAGTVCAHPEKLYLQGDEEQVAIVTYLPSGCYLLLHTTMSDTQGDPVRASVGHLLSRASSLPCSTAAQAFSQLVQPTSRFQLALDALLPLLDLDTQAELSQRILVSFILYALYAPHPMAINPFRSVLFITFVKERDQAVRMASTGGVSENEQLVWVLWKILKGDGNDIGPYSPSTLARSPLPPKLRAPNLILDEESDKHDTDDVHPRTTARDTHKSRTDRSTPDASSTTENTSFTPEDDAKSETIAHAIKLLLTARERVLTLAEQRFLIPLISHLTSPPMITSMDLAPLISHNPLLAHSLFVSLLISSTSTPPPHHHHHHHSHIPSAYLEVLPYLPPTLPTFDLMGHLLRDNTLVLGDITISELVRSEVLGRFIHESINWLDRAEREEREGLISDDRFPKGVQNLCRFYNSLIKLSIVNPASDTDTAEMAHFSLRHARFEEANALYRVLATGKF